MRHSDISPTVSSNRMWRSHAPEADIQTPSTRANPLTKVSIPFPLSSTDHLDPSSNHCLPGKAACNEKGILWTCATHTPTILMKRFLIWSDISVTINTRGQGNFRYHLNCMVEWKRWNVATPISVVISIETSPKARTLARPFQYRDWISGTNFSGSSIW